MLLKLLQKSDLKNSGSNWWFVLDVEPREIRQINFTENLDLAGIPAMYFIIE